tara:strand:- start:17 stop:280 length:264 start_codon:yes stop_codon:yes gene_type:complete
MKYIVTTWETLECKYEIEAEGKDDAWKRVLDNEGEQVAKNWLDNGSYIVELEATANPGKSSILTGNDPPGNVVDFKTKVAEMLRKKK